MRVTSLLETASRLSRLLLPSKLVSVVKTVTTRTLGPKVLYMVREDLDTLPPLDLPPEFSTGTVVPGREQEYVQVIQQSLEEDADEAWYRDTFSEDPDYDPHNLIVIKDGQLPVAVAAAWQSVWNEEKTGLIHMVGVDRRYLGRGLGRAVTIAALRRLAERGFQSAILSTEDYRIPAIGLYLSLGFQPAYMSAFHRWRWKRALEGVKGRSHSP